MSPEKRNTKTEETWAELQKFVKEQRGSPVSLAPEVREKAAQLYQAFLKTLPLRARKLHFVTLKLDTPYPTAIPREKIPEMIRRSPEFFEDWSEAVGEST